jgi:hypothetical protein
MVFLGKGSANKQALRPQDVSGQRGHVDSEELLRPEGLMEEGKCHAA